MKSTLTLNGAKLFGVKPLGNGCRFGVKINSRKQDGSYTQGLFVNCKHKEMLNPDLFYTLEGFLGDNEYNGNNTLEFIVMNATPEVLERKQNTGINAPIHIEQKQMPENLPNIDINEDEMPF